MNNGPDAVLKAVTKLAKNKRIQLVGYIFFTEVKVAPATIMCFTYSVNMEICLQPVRGIWSSDSQSIY